MSISIRAPEAGDAAAWRELWAGYNRFYRATVPDDVTGSLWQKLLAADGDIRALVAVRDGKLIGLAHYLFHPSSWSHAPSCYLEDMFVAKAARGSDAGEKLIQATAAAAEASGAGRLYWHTQEYNGAARSLYDTLAQRTSFVVYRKDID